MLSDCELWTRGQSMGYGATQLNGRNLRAHQAAWIVAHGPIPSGLVVHHLCGNRLCTNVHHLALMTARAHADLHAERVLICPRCGATRTYRPERQTYRCLACHARDQRARNRIRSSA